MVREMTDLSGSDYWEPTELDDSREIEPPVQEPDWVDCPILGRMEMFEGIKRCEALDGRSVNLFSALTRPRHSGLAELYLGEHLYRPGSHYVYVTPDVECYSYRYWQPVITKIAV